MTRKKTLGLFAVAVLLVTLLGGGVWAFAGSNGRGPWHNGPMGGSSTGFGDMMGDDSYDGSNGFGGGMMGRGMMGGTSFGIEGTGEVTTLDQAGTAAQRYAETLDLKVGEVMQFSDNFYAELLTASGDKATEVLVDPATGDVRIEFGPAMMWNTAYGMHSWGSTRTERVSPEQAQQIANRWLTQRQEGTTAGEAEAFPGYYTLHTLKDGEVTGMLSVNASTGAVWYHTWHGDFVTMTE